MCQAGLEEVLGHVNHFFNQISCFKHEPLFKIFDFAMILSSYGEERPFFITKFPDRQSHQEPKKLSQKWKF